MENNIDRLVQIVGQARLEEIAKEEQDDEQVSYLTNSQDIVCDCKTLILRPKHAKLILPTEEMLKVEKELKFFQQGDKIFKHIIHGCYWLIDDMYKFEQMGYTKEISSKNLNRPATTETDSANTDNTSNSTTLDDPTGQTQQPTSSTKTTSSVLIGLRYLACAECNLCPLGWFNPETKDSYLNVWSDSKK